MKKVWSYKIWPCIIGTSSMGRLEERPSCIGTQFSEIGLTYDSGGASKKIARNKFTAVESRFAFGVKREAALESKAKPGT